MHKENTPDGCGRGWPRDVQSAPKHGDTAANTGFCVDSDGSVNLQTFSCTNNSLLWLNLAGKFLGVFHFMWVLLCWGSQDRALLWQSPRLHVAGWTSASGKQKLLPLATNWFHICRWQICSFWQQGVCCHSSGEGNTGRFNTADMGFTQKGKSCQLYKYLPGEMWLACVSFCRALIRFLGDFCCLSRSQGFTCAVSQMLLEVQKQKWILQCACSKLWGEEMAKNKNIGILPKRLLCSQPADSREVQGDTVLIWLIDCGRQLI